MNRNWFKVIFTPLYLLLLTIILFLLLILWIFPWPDRWFCGWIEKLLATIKVILEKLRGWVSKLCPPDDTATHIITASKTGNGAIAPEGDIPVGHGATRDFNITPDPNHHLEQLLVDGVPVSPPFDPASGPYTSPIVTSDMTIEAIFAIDQYTITASKTGNGAIAPEGDIPVGHGATRDFNITPDPNHHLEQLLVDGVPVSPPFDPASGPYTSPIVTNDMTIEAIFAIDQYTITASKTGNGSIDPEGDTPVDHGDSQTFTITPHENQCVMDFEVDGLAESFSSAGGDYTFNNVLSNRTIKANFDRCIELICPEALVSGEPSSGNFDNEAIITPNILAGDLLTDGTFFWETSPNLDFQGSNTTPQPTVITNEGATPGQNAWIRLTYTASDGRVITAECSFPILEG